MKLSLESSGSGEPLVLIHGMGSASTAWKLIRPELSKKFTVITVDLPGHGKSDFDLNQPMDPTYQRAVKKYTFLTTQQNTTQACST